MPHTVQAARPPLVSVVMPCYIATQAQADRLDATLTTVTRQSCTDAEVIVVDDGSPIEVARISAAHPRTFTVRQPNAGPAVARNSGIDVARGGTFVFLDADDHLLPTALEALLDGLSAAPGCGFAVGPREEMTLDGTPVPRTLTPPPMASDLYLPLLGADGIIVPPSSAIFRREVVEALGGFRDPWGADVLDFHLRAAYRFRAHCFRGTAVTRYRRHGARSAPERERALYSLAAVYDRQWPLVAGRPEAEAAHRRGLATLRRMVLECAVQPVADGSSAGDGEAVLQGAPVLATARAEHRSVVRPG